MADQAISSLTNFALGLVVARTVTVSAFGAFSLAVSTYLLALGASRGLNSEPFLVRYSTTLGEHRRLATSWATGAALTVGTIVGGVCCAVAILAGGSSGSVFLALGLSLPGLLLQDAWRYCYVAEGRGRDAFWNDMTWAALLLVLFTIRLTSGRASAGNLLLLWGLSGSTAGVLAVARERLRPSPLGTLRWLSEQRDLAPRYMLEFLSASGSLQLTMYVVAILAGLATAGSLRAGLVVLGPVNVIFQGIRLVIVPEGVRLLRRSNAELKKMVRRLAVALALPSLAWGLVLLMLPTSVGRGLLGDSWQGARSIIVPLTLLLALSGVELATVVALRAMAAARHSVRARLIEGGLTLVAGTIGAAIGGTRVIAWALVAAYLLEVLVWWQQFELALNLRDAAPVDASSFDRAQAEEYL